MSASNIKSNLKEGAETLKDDARDALNSASDMGAALRDDAAAKIRQGADAAADHGQKIAENVRDFASRQTETGARIIDQVTSSVADMAEQVSAGPLGDLIAEGKSAVQRNPLAFLVGAVILGFAVGRIATSNSDRK
ncbi:MAG: hypothetical protein H7245_11055 [Candidatus Saccharibacteria bacterium]|nr:hypothetical protein [Pseudorhodobacter sp.]